MATHPTALKLGPADDGRALSAEAFAAAEFAEPWKYERQDGRLVVMSPEGQRHHDDSRPWRIRLASYWTTRPEVVEDLISGAWVRVHGGTDRLGDLGVYLAADGPVEPIPDRVPDLIFEFVSPGRRARDRDYQVKRAEYHRLGVREYVIVDCQAERVTVLTHQPDGYAERTLGPGDTYNSPLLPGLAIPLSDVL